VKWSRRVDADLRPNRLTGALRAVRAEGRAVIDLTLSNPTEAGLDYPVDLLASLSNPAALVYRPHPLGLPEARDAVAAEYARQGLTVAADRLLLTASTSDAYSLIFKVLCDPGDDVLVPRPSYPLFEHLTRFDGVEARPYDLEYHGRWSIDLASIERAWTPRTRAVLVVSPNNPTGSFVTREELDRIGALCGTREAAIVADEVFADYALDAAARRDAGRVLEGGAPLAFSLGGLSKSIGLPQAKLAWTAVAGDAALADAALARLELAADAYLSVSTPVQVAAGDLLARGASVRAQIQARVAANDRVLRAAVTAESGCEVLAAEGGWYGVVRVPAIAPEEDLVVALLTDEGVLAHPGYFFDFASEAFLVVSLLPDREQFREGVSRVLRHFACRMARP